MASTFLSELGMCYLEYYYSNMQEFETYVELTQQEHNLLSHSGNHGQQNTAMQEDVSGMQEDLVEIIGLAKPQRWQMNFH